MRLFLIVLIVVLFTAPIYAQSPNCEFDVTDAIDALEVAQLAWEAGDTDIALLLFEDVRRQLDDIEASCTVGAVESIILTESTIAEEPFTSRADFIPDESDSSETLRFLHPTGWSTTEFPSGLIVITNSPQLIALENNPLYNREAVLSDGQVVMQLVFDNAEGYGFSSVRDPEFADMILSEFFFGYEEITREQVFLMLTNVEQQGTQVTYRDEVTDALVTAIVFEVPSSPPGTFGIFAMMTAPDVAGRYEFTPIDIISSVTIE